MNEATEKTAHILTIAAAAVGDAFTAAGLRSEDYAFTLVLWPVGEPDRCSTICGSGEPGAQKESAAALAAASKKSEHPPSRTAVHRSGKPN